ncbi:MAG: toll/interleukin-1 receptor domain-containing protein [Clostridiales bacterium]|nr:toll/interleukin-1 receptor domain-containing protein [Clostridiales bacterium]
MDNMNENKSFFVNVDNTRSSKELVEELDWGPIKVIKGKHKGRIGLYDDDEGAYGYVYWGDMVSTLDAYDRIPKRYLSNQITTYDLVSRREVLHNTIARMRASVDEYYDENYRAITELYGEFMFVTELLTKVYEETFYYQSTGEKKIFISHSSKDKDISLWIASDLKLSNYNVWLDRWELFAGRSISKEISAGLEQADALVMIISNSYMKSAFCNDEWESYYMKYNCQKPNAIIPIIVDDCGPPALLAAKKYLRLKDLGYNEMISELRRALSHLLS